MILFCFIMTKQTKEAIKTSAVIVLVLLAVFFLWVYPLNQAGKIVERPEEEATALIELSEHNLTGEPFKILTEDNLSISGFYIQAKLDSTETPAKGIFILIHGLHADMSSQLAKAQAVTEIGYNAIIYDQRGYGQSDGDFRSGGFFEGNDLQSLLTRLQLEDRLVHPVILWGEDHGGTAGIRATSNVTLVDFCIAENPVVDGYDWQERVIKARDMSAPEFSLSFIWWWMKQNSSYEIEIEESELFDAYGTVTEKYPGHTLIITAGTQDTPTNDHISQLRDLGGNWLILESDDTNLFEQQKAAILERINEMVSGQEIAVE